MSFMPLQVISFKSLQVVSLRVVQIFSFVIADTGFWAAVNELNEATGVK